MQTSVNSRVISKSGWSVLIPLDKLSHTIHLPTYLPITHPPTHPINHHSLQLFNFPWVGRGGLQHRRQMKGQAANTVRRNNSGTNNTNTPKKAPPQSNHSGASSHR